MWFQPLTELARDIPARIAATVLASSLLAVPLARAQEPLPAPTPPPAAALPPAPAPDNSAATPASVLKQFPDGGPELVSKFRELANSPTNLQPIIGLVAGASRDQKSAIGSGLGQAARIALRRDRGYAAQIQQAVVTAADEELTKSFLAVIGDAPITAAGGGGGGAGAGGGGAVGGQTNPLGGLFGAGSGAAEGIGGGGVPTGAFTYSSSVTGGSSLTTSSTNSVSP